MKRLIAKTTDFSCNIKADRMEEKDKILRVYDGNELVAVFFTGVLESAYISESREKEQA